MQISIVIPTLNESAIIERTIDDVSKYLATKFSSFEILVVDDGSSDQTPDIVRKIAQKNPRVFLAAQNRWMGKGAAVRVGCLQAKGEIVIYMDADHATPIQELEKCLPYFERHTPCVVAGVRMHQEDEPRLRRILGLTCQLLSHLVVFQKTVPDSQCGFKALSQSVCKKVFSVSRTNGVMFDVELFHLLHRFSIPCYYVPVAFHNRKGSRMNFFRSALQDPFELLCIRMRDYLGVYGPTLKQLPA